MSSVKGHIDGKKYEKAIKTADSILKKHPNHGETLSLKGLAEHQTGNKEVGYHLARRGLRLDVTSAVCYHVLGVIYRNDRAFHQAKKYFQTALYHDPKNEKIMRDVAAIQLQLRDYEGHYKTRKALWTHRPDLRMNWVGYALAAHLIGEYDFAAHLVKVMQKSSLTDAEMPTNRWEVQNQHSEILLYHNFLLRDSKQYDLALSDILESKSRILDKIHARELVAELYLRTGKLEEARTAFLDLIHTNPDNITYHYGLIAAHGVNINIESIFTRGLDSTGRPVENLVVDFSSLLTPELRSTLSKLYTSLQEKYAKSLVTQQIPLLHWLEGAEFDAAFQRYARPMLIKGVPSLFNSVKSLYKHADRVAMIDAWVKSCRASLEQNLKFPGSDKSEDPTTLLWVYYFLALHECRLHAYDSALRVVNTAIEHTPTVMDIYLVKAKILSKAGDDLGAAEAVEKARTLDLADRNLNTLSVKYWLRACNPTKAAQNLSLFTKLDSSHYSNIYTMQVMWYEALCGQAYLRLGNLGKSLKAHASTVDHFYEINEDQYDFFHYAVRYFSLSTFVRLMRMEDRLRGQPHYISAAKGLVKAYLRLDDLQKSGADAQFSPARFLYDDCYTLEESPDAVSSATAASTPAASTAGGGKKKAPPPKKKAGDSNANASANVTTNVKPWNGKHDSDPHGDRLKSTKLPLKRAAPFAEILASHAWDDVEAQLLLVAYHLRTKQFLLALRALTRAIELKGAQNPLTHIAIVFFAIEWQKATKTPSEKLNAVVDTKLKAILNNQTLDVYADQFATSETAKQSFSARLAASSAYVLLGKKDEKVEALVMDVGQDKNYCVKSLLQGRYLIYNLWKNDLPKFKSAVHQTYPLVAAFAQPKPVPQEQVFEPTNGD